MAKIDELRALASDLRKRLRKVDQLTGRSLERDRDAQRKRAARAASKEVVVPACQNPARRLELETDDAQWLRYYFHELFPAPGGTGVELGVLDGFNSVALLTHAKPAVLHLVDVWCEYPACHPEGQPDGGVWLGDSARDKVIERLAPQIAAGQVKLHQADTVAWLAAREASSLDWVYLDSDHSYQHVRRELCQAMRVVKASGWICGHDYAAVLGGVVAAVNEFCREHGQELAIVTDEPEEPVIPRLAWSPATCPYNSFAIRVEK